MHSSKLSCGFNFSVFFLHPLELQAAQRGHLTLFLSARTVHSVSSWLVVLWLLCSWIEEIVTLLGCVLLWCWDRVLTGHSLFIFLLSCDKLLDTFWSVASVFWIVFEQPMCISSDSSSWKCFLKSISLTHSSLNVFRRGTNQHFHLLHPHGSLFLHPDCVTS